MEILKVAGGVGGDCGWGQWQLYAQCTAIHHHGLEA